MPTLASRTAERVEYAGYGPCIVIAPGTIETECSGITSIMRLAADGTVVGEAPVIAYRNPVIPEVQAVMSVIALGFVERGGLLAPLRKDRTTVISFTESVSVHLTYLWMHLIEQNKRLVLTELMIEGVPAWHGTSFIDYNVSIDNLRWNRLSALFSDFLENGGVLPASKSFSTLTECASACVLQAAKEQR